MDEGFHRRIRQPRPWLTEADRHAIVGGRARLRGSTAAGRGSGDGAGRRIRDFKRKNALHRPSD